MGKMVSFIMPVRGGGVFFKLALDSMLAQDHAEIEVLIIDDGIDDEARKSISNSADYRIRIIKSNGGGLVNSLNTGISAAKGEFIARMDSDDICDPSRISRQISVFEQFTEADVVYSDVYLINEKGAVLRRQNPRRGGFSDELPVLLQREKGYPIVHPSVMVRKSVLDAVGGYRHYEAAEDRDLWLRLCHSGRRFYRIPDPLLQYRLNSAGVSSIKRNIQQINSMCSIINFDIVQHCGVDMYSARPELLADIATKVKREVERYSQIQEASIKFKSRLRSLEIFNLFGDMVARNFYLREMAWIIGGHYAERKIINKYVRVAGYYLES